MTGDVASANTHMFSGDFEGAIEILKKEDLDKPKVLFMLSQCYMLSGQFDKAYRSFKDFKEKFSTRYLQNHEMDYLNEADQIINVFSAIGYDNYNIKPNSSKVIQSIERADETYPESDFIRSVMECTDKTKKNRMLSDIDIKRNSHNVREKEEGFFAAGHVFFSTGEFETSFDNYIEAIKLAPNKALYYGYAANALFREGVKHFENESKLISYSYISSKFARQAIELDYRNPRWHFYQSLALSTLVTPNHHHNYIIQAATELELAFKLCRDEQERLRGAIVTSMNNLAEVRDNLRDIDAQLLPAPVLNRL